MKIDVDRWRRIEAVLDAALAQDPTRWPRVLDEMCGGDEEMLREVEGLLARVGAAERFLSSPPSGIAARFVAEDRVSIGARYVGRRIGAYRIVQQVGRGGMARVFLAERADGHFEQQVALKLLRPGFDSDVDVERFRAERQILATLNHPNIAKLLDGGVTDDGLPYLVLEYVEGDPIDRYCNTRGFGSRARLELFLKVADALQYAHGRGVVHRDLKPSNILIATDGTPKLLDFGLARMMEEGVTGEAPPTRTGHRWMTPEYAAPEQIRGTAITPHTDVYQLGAVLYELLGGRTPFAGERQTLHEMEMAALINEPEPLGDAFKGDVDAMLLKALRKRPEERYASAGELAQDIRRHLRGYPVLARQQTLGYRARRFATRHRRRLLVGSIAALVLVTSVAAVMIERRRSQGVESIRQFTLALEAAVVDSVAHDSSLLRDLLGRVQGTERLSVEPQMKARIVESAGHLHVRLGETKQGIALLHQAVVLRRQLARPSRADTSSAIMKRIASYAGDPVRRGMLFTRAGDIYLMDADGTNEVRLTRTPESGNSAASWAADGRRILFSRTIGVARGIFIMNPDGTGVMQLTAPPAGWQDYFPSGVGEHVLFVRSNDVRRSIYRVNLDGSGLTELTSGPNDDDIALFPWDNLIAFRSNNDIYLLDLQSGERTRLTHSPDVYKGGLAVSPDGKRIAFARIDPGRLEQIFVMDVDGKNVRRVSRGDYYDFLPRWSPDGTRIGFTSSRDGSLGVYSMRLDGSDVVDLSRTSGRMAMRPGVGVPDVTEALFAWCKY